MFMFEGNGVALEIYHQMQNKRVFFTTITYALVTTALLILTIAFFSYYCYGEETKAVILLNLDPNAAAFIV